MYFLGERFPSFPLPPSPPASGVCSGLGPRFANVKRMEIEDFFRSKSFYMTFAIFFDFPHDPLHARLIARATGCDVKCVHRQLARLARCGAIRQRDAGKEKWYRLRATCWKSSMS